MNLLSLVLDRSVTRVSALRPFSLLSILLVLSSTVSFGQALYLPVSHEVYPFLQRMESRGLLAEYRDAAKPLSRKTVAAHLKKLESATDRMTSVERATYEFLKAEFGYELLALAGDPDPSEIRGHIFSFKLNEGIMNIDLVGKYTYSRSEGEPLRIQSHGARTYGYAYKDIGFYFNFVDNREVGKKFNISKNHTPDPGVILTRSSANWIEYNTTEAQFTYQAGEFELAIEKMQNVWGAGRRGNVILSTKALSYPQFKLRVPLTSWMDFIYLHADLNSNVLDSSRSYKALSSSRADFYRPVYRQKYMAAHLIELTPWRGVDFAIGESIVYSDKNPQFIYLIPIMFFKSAEHYNRDTDNAQIFGSLDLNLIRGLNFYATMFIDEINTDALLNPNEVRNQIGYTLGIQTYDLPLENLELLVEYSRLNPWAYSHKFPAATFTNNGYDLGHWIGQNADNLFIDVKYTPFRSLHGGIFHERYRKGGRDDVVFQYSLPSKPFLYPPVHREQSTGVYSRYQFVREGFLEFRGRRITISDEAFPALNKQGITELSVSISYGVW